MKRQNHFMIIIAIMIFQLTFLSAQNNISIQESSFDIGLEYGELSISDNSDDIILNFVGDGAVPARIVMTQFFNYIKSNGLNFQFNFHYPEVQKYAAEMAIY